MLNLKSLQQSELDIEPPVVSISHMPTDLSEVISGDTIEFTATATDNTGVKNVSLNVAGTNVVLDENGKGSYIVPAEGSYTATATAIDINDNIASTNYKFTIVDMNLIEIKNNLSYSRVFTIGSTSTGYRLNTGESFTVDWGDGNRETLTGSVSYSHTYSATTGIVVVKITGNFTKINFSGNKNLGIVEVVKMKCPKVIDFLGVFSANYNLTTVPRDMFDRSTNIANISACFSTCSKLLIVPSFDKCTKVTSFASCFSECTSLTTVPATLFDSCLNTTRFDFCFYKCSGITSAVPDLWNTAKFPNVTSKINCFMNCTKAVNYASIPSGWK